MGDESGKLGIAEFKKLVRMFHDRERVKLTHELINRGIFDAEHTDTQRLHKAEIRQALTVLGCFNVDVEMEIAVVSEDGYDTHATIAAVMRCRDRIRKTYRRNAGFAPDEVKKLQEVFQQYDKDNTGTVDRGEMVKFIERMIPGVAASKSFRPKLMELISRAGAAGEDSSLRLEFVYFVRLIRHIHDLGEHEQLSKEHSAVLMSLFGSDEVRGFREIFVSKDEDGQDSLSFGQVKDIIHGVIPIGDKLTMKLRSLWSGKASKGGDIGNIDFAEFLTLMKRLLDINFGGLRDVGGGGNSIGKLSRIHRRGTANRSND